MKKLSVLLLVPIAFALPLIGHAQIQSTSTKPTYTVTIDMYVDGHPATTDATSAGGATFPMNSWWSAKNLGIGKGVYTLGPTGFNSPNSYEAVTSDMTEGANYNTRETISWVKNGGVVSGNCRTGDPFMLKGYTWGDTLAEAAAGTPTTDAWPRFLNMTGNKYVIIWNQHCLTAPTHVSPVNGAKVTSANQVLIDWSDVTSPYGTVSYYYEASHSYAVPAGSPDGAFADPIYKSSALSTSEIPTPSTTDGIYYWHVKAVDTAGNSSPWSAAYNLKVVN